LGVDGAVVKGEGTKKAPTCRNDTLGVDGAVVEGEGTKKAPNVSK